MSKTKKIVLTVIIIVISLAILAWIFVPRLFIWYAAKQITPDMRPAAEYFTEYSATLENGQPISHDGLTMTIPDNYIEEELALKYAIMYVLPHEEETDTECVVFMTSSDLSDMNLFSEENVAQLTSDLPSKIGVDKLIKGFEALGNGLPDSAYNTYKSTSLLTEDDYSFWNLNQGFAYVISGMLKSSTWQADKNYIYETEDICGLIYVREQTEKNYKYYIVVDMFSTDDLDTCYGLLIRSNSLEQAYAMINSIVIE